MAEKTIFCPHCNEELALDEEYLGMEVECPVCQKAFVAQQKPLPEHILLVPSF